MHALNAAPRAIPSNGDAGSDGEMAGADADSEAEGDADASPDVTGDGDGEASNGEAAGMDAVGNEAFETMPQTHQKARPPFSHPCTT